MAACLPDGDPEKQKRPVFRDTIRRRNPRDAPPATSKYPPVRPAAGSPTRTGLPNEEGKRPGEVVPLARIELAAHGLGIRNSKLPAFLKYQQLADNIMFLHSTLFPILCHFSPFWIKSLTQILTQETWRSIQITAIQWRHLDISSTKIAPEKITAKPSTRKNPAIVCFWMPTQATINAQFQVHMPM